MSHGVPSARNRRRDDPLRLFVAAYPPADIASAMLGACRALELPAHRLVPPEQVHLTLHFVGDTPAAELDEVEESVRRSVAGLEPFFMRVVGVRRLPERGPARLVAAEAQSHPTLNEIHRRLVHRLALKPRGRERFLPHFTLARFAGGGAHAAVGGPAGPWEFELSDVVLVRSVLHPSGAEHEEVMRARLG